MLVHAQRRELAAWSDWKDYISPYFKLRSSEHSSEICLLMMSFIIYVFYTFTVCRCLGLETLFCDPAHFQLLILYWYDPLLHSVGFHPQWFLFDVKIIIRRPRALWIYDKMFSCGFLCELFQITGSSVSLYSITYCLVVWFKHDYINMSYLKETVKEEASVVLGVSRYTRYEHKDLLRGDYTIFPENCIYIFVPVITFFPFLLCK